MRHLVTRFVRSTLLLGAIFCAAQPALLAQIQVTSTTPNNGQQGTVNLSVTVNGKGFKNGAQAKWFVTGTTNPGGITVNSTAFVNSTTLTTNITIADTAVIANFDVQVQNADGRTGKGSELFAVLANSKKTTCTAPTPLNIIPNACVSGTGQPGCLDSTFGNSQLVPPGGLVLTTTGGGGAIAVKQQSDGKLVAMGWGTSSQSVGVFRYNGDGSLDSTFGSGGFVQYQFAAGAVPTPKDGTLDQNGNILVLGSTSSGGFLLRFSAAGTADTAFNASASSSLVGANAAIGGMLVQPDGKIVVGAAGSSKSSGNYGLVYRLNQDGTLDRTFGTNGSLSLSGLDRTFVALQTTNSRQYILAGSKSSAGFAVTRLTSTGAVDASFGSNGMTTTAVCTNSGILGVAVDSVGAITAMGITQLVSSGPYKLALAHYSPNGILDTTFGDASTGSSGRTGTTMLDFFGSTNQPTAIVPIFDSNGIESHFLVAANAFTPTGGKYLAIARYNPDGSLDNTFGIGGAVATDFGSQNQYTVSWPSSNLALQTDGKIVVGGLITIPSGPYAGYNVGLARYWP
jgi:uncharacterized delta-60 repeat protein